MKKIFYSCGILSLIMFQSCGSNDDGPAPTPPTAEPTVQPKNVNDFVWKGLNSWYFWKEDVPELQDDYFSDQTAYANFVNAKEPDDLFYSLLVDNKIDKYSWIVDDVNELLRNFSGISLSSGMDLSLTYFDQNEGTVIGLVNYVVPNSPAAEQGIKRGDVIYGIDGATMNDVNYRNLFSENFAVKIGRGVTFKNSELNFAEELTFNITSREVDENPVHFAEVYQVDNHKIGYLVYNGYKNTYNDELNEAFAYFKEQNVTDFILDLRYNGGGSLASAVGLAQMITGSYTGNKFVSLEFNDEHSQYNEVYNLENEVSIYDFINGESKYVSSESINSINMDKIYVLTSNGTASASELTISALRPFIDVELIGSQTYGKFVGSITLFDSPASDFTSYENRDKSHDWAMQPIVFAYFNSRRELFTEGLPVQHQVSFADYLGMEEFGNPKDKAFAKAMSLITGNSYKMANKKAQIEVGENIGTSKTLKKFGTELYIEPNLLKK